jgi:hypothetical protein
LHKHRLAKWCLLFQLNRSGLADANIDLALERAYTQIACGQAGIEDVEAFKKKHPGGQRT